MYTKDRAGVSIRLIGSARLPDEEMAQLVTDLSAAVAEEPGNVGYRWSRAAEPDGWVIEEEYTDEPALAEHVRRLGETGLLRRMGKAFRIERLVVVSGDPEAVGKQLGLTPSPDVA